MSYVSPIKHPLEGVGVGDDVLVRVGVFVIDVVGVSVLVRA